MPEVIITGWQRGLQALRVIKLIQRYTGVGLSRAKSVADRVLNGETVIVTVAEDEAASFVERLTAARAEARLVE